MELLKDRRGFWQRATFEQLDKETELPGSTDSPEALGFKTSSVSQRTRVKNSEVTAGKPQSGVTIVLTALGNLVSPSFHIVKSSLSMKDLSCAP